MRPPLLNSSIALLLLLFGDAMAGDAPAPANCKRVDAPRSAWTHPATGSAADRIWISRPDCRPLNAQGRHYRAVSGGYRYEGIWDDAAMTKKWQVVGSEPYVSAGVVNVDGWLCMVISTGPETPQMPTPIWCSVTCCPD